MSSNNFDENRFNSRLSFGLLIEMVKQMIAEGKPGYKKLYGNLISRIEAIPELMTPTEDITTLESHRDLIEMLMAMLFPPTNPEEENIFAVTMPFRFETIYSSSLFRTMFLHPGSNLVNVPGGETGVKLSRDKVDFAYKMILAKHAGQKVPVHTAAIYPVEDPRTGLVNYFAMCIDARFINVRPIGEFPEMPLNLLASNNNHALPLDELIEQVPLENFVFEGLAVVRIKDVTEHEVINQIKNQLLNVNSYSDNLVYEQLQAHLRSLLGISDLQIGITPFFLINNHYVYSDIHSCHSLLYKKFASDKERDSVNDCCFEMFKNNDRPVVFEKITEDDLCKSTYLRLYHQLGARSLIISPLIHEHELVGVMEIVSKQDGQLTYEHVAKIEKALPLFTLALAKSAEALDNQVDKVIKEKFTAVQPVVEWKFTEAALKYVVDRQSNEEAKTDRISFEDVYPLYGSIDIRNSSVERAHSIQLDMIEQLNLARGVIAAAEGKIDFPLLREIGFRIDKYIASTAESLVSDEEIAIHDFLANQLLSVFKHLEAKLPGIRKDINAYFSALDNQHGIVYHHRKDYDESIAKINQTLARFIDKEQFSAQQVYPHYFERYVTDGVEFNIYIGQSLAPRKKFDELYLRNLKMWQLTLLAKAARISGNLEKELPNALRTTQLILAHSIPISISFRADERKFDVDGAYNIRYEIIKKRIDKVHIKETEERLTQPGKLAIVYSQPKEAVEYAEYIEFLQNEGLLKNEVEHFDLEELQGVTGLKALRVEIIPEEIAGEKRKIEVPEVELSTTTTGQLLG